MKGLNSRDNIHRSPSILWGLFLALAAMHGLVWNASGTVKSSLGAVSSWGPQGMSGELLEGIVQVSLSEEVRPDPGGGFECGGLMTIRKSETVERGGCGLLQA